MLNVHQDLCQALEVNLFLAITNRFLQVSVVTNLINSLALFPAITKYQWQLFDAREAKPVDEERSVPGLLSSDMLTIMVNLGL